MESRMLKKILISLLVFIFLLNISSAVDINFFKEKYMSGDSVQTEIDFGNLSLIQPLTYSNIKLYNNENKIPLNLNLYKIENKSFVYFDLPALEAKDYNFVLEDIIYSEKGILKRGNFNKNLTVVDGRGISVNPALIYLNIESWENPRIAIEIKNKASEDITVSFETSSDIIKFNREDRLIEQGKIYVLSMVLDMRTYVDSKFKSGLVIKYLNGSYKIPIIVNRPSTIISEDGKISEISNVSVSEVGLKFAEEGDRVNRSLRKEDSLEGPLRFKNLGTEIVYNLNFELTEDLANIVKYNYSGDYKLEGGEEENIYIYINKNKNIDRNYSGELIISGGDNKIKLPFYIYYIPEEVIVNNNIIEQNFISNHSEVALPAPKKKSNLIVYIIFGIFLIILLYLIYYFYKKGKPETKKFESLIPTFQK